MIRMILSLRYVVILCVSMLYILGACTTQAKPIVNQLDITTSPDHYRRSVIEQKSNKQDDGFVGVIKIFVEHGVEDVNGSSGTYIAQGTGIVFVKNSKWLVVTAKHMVIPNHKLQSIGLDLNDLSKKVTFTTIRKTGASILIGNLSVEPSTIWFPMEEETDIAVLEIPETMSESIIHPSVALNIDSTQFPDTRGLEGKVVKIWGYPARQAAQLDSASISDTQADYFILNKELEQGYSGGPVLVSIDNMEVIAGMVIRTDHESNQSTVLSWSTAEALLNAVAQNSSSVKKVVVNEIIEYPKDVMFQFAALHTLPFTTTVQSPSWQFWK